MDTFFGHPRPEIVCASRIDLRVPIAPGLNPHGRPIKVWTGASDAEESAVQLAICEHPLLCKAIRSRQLAPDGFLTLKGTLTHSEGTQNVVTLEIEFQFIQLDSRGSVGDTDWMQKAFDTYVKAMTDLKKSHDDAMSKMSEAFSNGMGKITKHSKDMGKVARKLEKDRAALHAALIHALAQKPQAQSNQGKSTLEQGIQALTLIKGFADKPTNGGNTDV